MTDITSPCDVGGTTTTAGTGPFIISGTIGVAGGGTYRAWSTVPNGSRVHCERADVGGANYERGIADVANVGGTVTLTWNPRIETSAASNSPVSWAGGSTQTVWPVSGSVHPLNGGSEFAPVAAAFRGSIGLGDASIHPSYRLGLVPSGAGVDGAWTGGTVGKVVRWSSANTMANASNTDTDAQLSLLAFLTAQGYFTGVGLITGLSVLTAGAVYFLGAAGAILAWTSGALPVTVTPGGSAKLVRVGFAPSTTSLLWEPQLLVRG